MFGQLLFFQELPNRYSLLLMSTLLSKRMDELLQAQQLGFKLYGSYSDVTLALPTVYLRPNLSMACFSEKKVA